MNTFFQKNRKISSVVALVVFLLITPIVFVYAATQDPPTITNPLGNGITDIPSLISIIVTAVKNIGYFIIVFFIIYSGFLFVKARGDEKEITAAKNTFLWTVVGAAVLLGAQILSDVIKNTVNQVGGQTRNEVPITQQDIV